MTTRTATCPRCNRTIEQRHDGTAQGTSDHTDPWVFVDHEVPDQRGDSVTYSRCVGSGRNVALARGSA